MIKTSTFPSIDARKYVATDGITIPDDAKDAPEGSFGGSAFAGRVMRLSLTGNTVNALLDYTGKVSFTSDGKLAKGTEKLKPIQIMTSKQNEKWLRVSLFDIAEDGALTVIDESGNSYKVTFGPNMNGHIEELQKAEDYPVRVTVTMSEQSGTSMLTWECVKPTDLSSAIVSVINSQTGKTVFVKLPQKQPFALAGLPLGDYTVCVAGAGGASSKEATQISNMAKFTVK
jgi:hypothetical protein